MTSEEALLENARFSRAFSEAFLQSQSRDNFQKQLGTKAKVNNVFIICGIFRRNFSSGFTRYFRFMEVTKFFLVRKPVQVSGKCSLYLTTSTEQ